MFLYDDIHIYHDENHDEIEFYQENMPNLQAYYNCKLDLQNVDQHAEGKWLIHGSKRHKDNLLQSRELP